MQEQILSTYQKELKELFKSGKANEHSFRTPFENLLKALAPKGVKILHEPKAEKEQSFIRPDFKVYKLVDKKDELSFNSLIGFIECKAPSEDLRFHSKSSQLHKYLQISPNIILTNYKSFLLLSFDKVISSVNLLDDDFEPHLMTSQEQNEFLALLQSFFSDTNTSIKSKAELIKVLSSQSFYLSLALKNAYDNKSKISSFHNFFKKTYETFNSIQGANFSELEFCDILAQSIVYGLFVSLVENEKFEIEKIPIENFNTILPEHFKTLNEFLYFALPSFSLPESIKYSLENVRKTLALLDKASMSKFLNTELESIAIYLYEDFLKAYDELRATQKRKEGGVFYTPPAVVKAIVASLDELLIKKFDKKRGFADERIKVLDFATGTGSFLAEVFEFTLKRERKIFKLEGIKKFLQNIYGFELNFASYVVARLKLGQILKREGFKDFDELDFQIYLTNTLDLDAQKREQKLFMPLENLNEEWQKANKVKHSENLLVILGNPPYNAKSKNKEAKILELLQTYKEGLNEQKINLDDDYIKFIRFAQWRLLNEENENPSLFECKKGLMGFITNNSYLSGRTHRKMRQSLYKSFDEIYIINLHGSDKEPKEDINVFDIKIGVCIALFVKFKDEQSEGARLFYYSTLENDIYKREDKFSFLESLATEGLNSLEWQELEPKEPHYFFVPKNFENEEYENFWALAGDKAAQTMQNSAPATGGGALNSVFENFSSGIQTKRDELTIHFLKQNLEAVIQDFQILSVQELKEKYKVEDSRDWTVQKAKKDIEVYFKDLEQSPSAEAKLKAFQKIAYRPFDIRYTFFMKQSRSFIAYPRYEIMQHFLQGENLGLCFTKDCINDFDSSLISSTITDIHYNGGQCYIAPLYLYKNEKELDKLEAVPNFTKEFLAFKEKSEVLKHKSPEQILAFIYATLYNPNYRKKYLEYLKIGFPRINFEVSAKEFDFFACVGQRLMNLHLMKEALNDDEIDFEGEFDTSVTLKPLRENERFKENAIFLDEKLKITGISKEIWEYKIGGYEVLKTWLKYRKNKELFKEDLEHLLQICLIIKQSLILQKELENFALKD